MAQETITNGDTGLQVRTDINNNFTELYTDRHSHDNKSILDNVTAAFTSELETLLNGIEAGAEVNTINSSNITNIVSLTQAEYDLLTPDSTTLYVITD